MRYDSMYLQLRFLHLLPFFSNNASVFALNRYLSNGARKCEKISIRVNGIDTPESRTRDLEEKKRGLEAKDRLESLLKEHKETLFIKSHGTGKFGRCLGELLFKEYDEFQDEFVVKNINRQLVNEGHAVEYFGGKR